MLNHIQFEVLEQGQREFVVAQDPEAACDVIGNLSVFLALLKEQFL